MQNMRHTTPLCWEQVPRRRQRDHLRAVRPPRRCRCKQQPWVRVRTRPLPSPLRAVAAAQQASREVVGSGGGGDGGGGAALQGGYGCGCCCGALSRGPEAVRARPVLFAAAVGPGLCGVRARNGRTSAGVLATVALMRGRVLVAVSAPVGPRRT